MLNKSETDKKASIKETLHFKVYTTSHSSLEISFEVLAFGGDCISDVFPPRKPAWKDRSTATCVLAVDNTLYIANLGDSRVCGSGATHLAHTMFCGEEWQQALIG